MGLLQLKKHCFDQRRRVALERVLRQVEPCSRVLWNPHCELGALGFDNDDDGIGRRVQFDVVLKHLQLDAFELIGRRDTPSAKVAARKDDANGISDAIPSCRRCWKKSRISWGL